MGKGEDAVREKGTERTHSGKYEERIRGRRGEELAALGHWD